MASELREPAKEIISIEFLLEIEKLRQDKSQNKWTSIIEKINDFTRSDSSRLMPIDLKNAVLHTAYGEALIATSRRAEGVKEYKLGLEILSLVKVCQA